MTTYSIKEVAEKTGLTAHTLRYYDKEGLLPLLEKSESGIRRFTDNDLEWLSLITCLKGTGMSIASIREYITLALKGDETAESRLQIFLKQKENVERQIETLQKHLDTVNWKIEHYKDVLVKGESDFCEENSCCSKLT